MLVILPDICSGRMAASFNPNRNEGSRVVSCQYPARWCIEAVSKYCLLDLLTSYPLRCMTPELHDPLFRGPSCIEVRHDCECDSAAFERLQ